jgi:putative DNA-invertase from lambdoid prophage Rac
MAVRDALILMAARRGQGHPEATKAAQRAGIEHAKRRGHAVSSIFPSPEFVPMAPAHSLLGR